MSGSVGAYLAQVDWALRSGQNLYPPSLGPVGIATDLPPTPPPPPGTSATADGATGAAGERDRQLRTAAGVDAAATSTAKSGAGEAQAGRAGAAGVRSTAAAQAAAIAPATGHPAGVRALVSAMDDKLAAMQRQLSTTQAQNRLLAARMRQLARAYRAAGRTGGGGGPPARWAGSSGLSGLSGVSTLASGVSGLASAPSAAVSSLTSPATSLIGSAARPLRQFTSPGRSVSPSSNLRTPVGALLPGVADERGLQRNTILAARAISAAFPEIREIGGYRRDRLHWHPNGLAIDVMIPNYNTAAGRALGDRVLQFVLTHGERFGLDNAIWRQTLYEENGSASRMGNLGNPTANHFDHVHIATTGGGYPRGRQMYVL